MCGFRYFALRVLSYKQYLWFFPFSFYGAKKSTWSFNSFGRCLRFKTNPVSMWPSSIFDNDNCAPPHTTNSAHIYMSCKIKGTTTLCATSPINKWKNTLSQTKYKQRSARTRSREMRRIDFARSARFLAKRLRGFSIQFTSAYSSFAGQAICSVTRCSYHRTDQIPDANLCSV